MSHNKLSGLCHIRKMMNQRKQTLYPILLVCALKFILAERGNNELCGGDKTPHMMAGYATQALCDKKHVIASIKSEAPCKPREKVIRVPLPNNTVADHVTPSHITVLRCSGRC